MVYISYEATIYFHVNILLFFFFSDVYSGNVWLCQSRPAAFISSQKYSVAFRVLFFEDFHGISQNAVTCEEFSQASEAFREFCGARAWGSEEEAAHSSYKVVNT